MTHTATIPATPTAHRARRHAARALRAVSRSADPALSGTALILVVVGAVTGSLPSAWIGLVVLLALFGLISITETAAVAAADAIDPDLRDGDAACEAAVHHLRTLARDLREGSDPADVYEALNRTEVLLATGEVFDELARSLTLERRFEDATAVQNAAATLNSADRAMVGHTETAQEQR